MNGPAPLFPTGLGPEGLFTGVGALQVEGDEQNGGSCERGRV